MLASLGKLGIRGKLWSIGSLMMPMLLFVFAWIRWLPLSLAVLLGVGWGQMMVINSTNAMVQSHVSDELRGRVMGIYTLVFFGSMPLGALFAGIVADRLGEPLTVMISSGFLLICAVLTWVFIPAIRRQE
jgi:predicted MFS family arabinose efflux permease